MHTKAATGFYSTDLLFNPGTTAAAAAAATNAITSLKADADFPVQFLI